MFRCSFQLVAISITLILTGCSGHSPTAQHQQVSKQMPANAVPVYIIPNCQMLDGKRYCQWIEPKGYQQNVPAVTNPQRVDGIAL